MILCSYVFIYVIVPFRDDLNLLVLSVPCILIINKKNLILIVIEIHCLHLCICDRL